MLHKLSKFEVNINNKHIANCQNFLQNDADKTIMPPRIWLNLIFFQTEKSQTISQWAISYVNKNFYEKISTGKSLPQKFQQN